jgi:FKBP-type peptidyl-prolyl cis-trans isomerase SlyD
MASQNKIAKDLVVEFHYELHDDEGNLLDTSREDDSPMVYLHGHQNVVVGLEKAMEGHKVGDKFKVVVSPDEGYGPKEEIDLEVVPRSEFEGMEDMLEVGMPIYFDGESEDEDDEAVAWVNDVTDTEVVLDWNHPLAGLTLHFDVEILEIRAATPEELEAGCPCECEEDEE